MANHSPRTDHLTPWAWQKGRTGNPAGSSRKSRIRRTVREATADLLSTELPDSIQEQLAEELKGLGPRQAADAIALRLVFWALTSRADIALAAIRQIGQLEPRERAQPEERDVPQIPDTAERRAEVLEALREAGALDEVCEDHTSDPAP